MKAKSVSFFTVLFILSLFLPGILFSQENTCNSCGGQGFQDCIRCDGGSYACPNCGGAGGNWELCNCNNGIVNMPDGTQQVCNYCKGECRVWHSCYNPLCNSGTVICNFCGGQGVKSCPVCNGTGKR